MAFYTLGHWMRFKNVEPFTEEYYRLNKRYWAEVETTDDAIYTRDGGTFCPVCGRLIKLRWAAPRQITVSGTRYPDYFNHWIILRMIVSEKFKRMYEAEHLTGITDFENLECIRYTKRKNGTMPPRYYNAIVPYSESVRLDVQKTVFIGKTIPACERPGCPHCLPIAIQREHVQKLALDTSNWDGKDIFLVYGHSCEVFSQRAYDKIMEYGLTNFDLVDVDEYSY